MHPSVSELMLMFSKPACNVFAAIQMVANVKVGLGMGIPVAMCLMYCAMQLLTHVH